jgi:hypothetical protein
VRILANTFGFLSLAISSWFWLALGLKMSSVFVTKFDPAFVTWTLIWVAALIAALLAGFLGSKRWFFVSAFPVLNFFGCIVLVNLQEPR